MAPTQQEYRRAAAEPAPVEPALTAHSIVVSGMSGLFPGAASVRDFSDLLYNQVNPVGKEGLRWSQKHPEATEWMGTVPGLDRFDSQFFMVHRRLGDAMDPMARKVLEHCYQAIYDAGINPRQLSGKKVGVYVAASFSDTEKFGLIDRISKMGYGISGVSKTMFANRVSYWLNAKGPSLAMDGASCGAPLALQEAVRALRSGTAECAIVAAANVCLAPYSLVHYSRCFKTTPDGATRSFDEQAQGCALSEAITVLFIQKAKDALRAYAEVVHVNAEFISHLSDVTGQSFGFVRDPAVSADFLRRFYREACVPPANVSYVEACGSATPEADKAELESIEEVFCKDRSSSLLVGSVTSNVGFTDAASGAVALTKVLLACQRGELAANLHCTQPRRDVRALRDGRMCVVTEHATLPGHYVAVNSLCYTGANAHVLLRTCSALKEPGHYATGLPRLVAVSARQEHSVHDMFQDLKSRPVDPEEIALLHNIHSTNIPGHLGRGYIILDTREEQTACLSESVQYCDGAARPLWFVYSGMGSQWAGMGAQLMRIPVFAAAIERCRKVLEPRGVDIVDIITSPDKSTFDNILHSFVGIAAVQIGLTDVLLELGLVPDNMLGHSVGELGCAYADGCLTAEEMILSAYSRGRVSLETPFIRGSMAAVGLGAKQMESLCPPEITIACHNSAESCTISGPADIMRTFVTDLTARGVFAKEVPCSNIAYHSPYIAEAGPALLKYLKEVIKTPRARSARWVSTSVPQQSWEDPRAKSSSAEYHTNNLLSPVLFEEALELIQSNAVVVEVAPHGLLQAILKRALPATVANIPLTRRSHEDSVVMLLDAVGKLHMAGFPARLAALYPRVAWPVSAGTPHLAHHVQWFHDETWSVLAGVYDIEKTARFVPISVHDHEYSYLTGNVVQGEVVLPWGVALQVVWDAMCTVHGLSRHAAVRFRDVQLHALPALRDQRPLEIHVTLQRVSGRFEVSEMESRVAEGYVDTIEELSLAELDVESESKSDLEVSAEEVYSELASRGLEYSGVFRGLERVSLDALAARVRWHGSWPALLEALLQLHVMRAPHAARVMRVRELAVHARAHHVLVHQASVLTATINPLINLTRCGGVVVRDMTLVPLPPHPSAALNLQHEDHTDCVNSSSQMQLTSRKNYALRIANVGDLESLHWEEVPTTPVGDGGIPVRVEFASVTVADAARALGAVARRPDETCFGMDFSGTTDNGSRVMGLLTNGAASTRVVARPELAWPVPAYWTLAEAATVPLAYMQALYYLVVRGGLRSKQIVLVEGAAGALGQAAVSVALAHGARVFATVADAGKKRFLLDLFPQLDENDVGNSRDDSFGDMILSATRGRRCDIVLSCARGNLRHISQKCSGPYGITIDLAHYLEQGDRMELGMNCLTDERTYIVADFHSVLENESKEELERLHALLGSGIACGWVRPLTHVVYAPAHAARALRLLAASRNRGRVLLALRDHTSSLTSMGCSPGRKLGLRDVVPALVADPSASLRQLGLEEWAPALQAWLLTTHRISLDLSHVLDLSANRISELELEAKEPTFEDVSGLGTFFTMVNSDEVEATAKLVPLETLATHPDTMVNGLDAARTTLFIVPGLEGLSARFEQLGARLQLPAAVLQPGLDLPDEKAHSLSKRYAQILLDQFRLKKNFYLLGFEFGVEVALEVAALLEDNGLTGTVFCVGSGPEELRAFLERELAVFPTQVALQEALVQHLSSLLGRAPHSTQYTRAVQGASFARIKRARAPPPAPPALRSRLVLMHARDVPAPCSLQHYSRQPLTVHELHAPLAHAARDLRVPAIINKYLHEDGVRAFQE